jgi:Mg-chelatase subunit ChlD
MPELNRSRRPTRVALVVLLLAASGWVAHAKGSAPSPPTPTPVPSGHAAIEAVFVLDTTGSMSGLLDGAKQKIWSIANEMAAASQGTRIRVGLIGYRDRGDQYVTRRFDLTEDIDLVYGNLLEFRAQGGGDTPESVNQALHEAVTTMSWSRGTGVYRVIFLVGDAPPQMNYGDDVPYAKSARLAAQHDIVINAVQCGEMSATTPIWQEIASLGGGEYAAIAQDGAMVAIRTPLDEELARLGREVAETVLPYGSPETRSELNLKRARSLEAPAPAQAERLAYLSKLGGRVNLGAMDLLDAISSGAVDAADVPEAELPEEMRELSADEREDFVEERLARRSALRQRIAELSSERDVAVRSARRSAASEGKSEGFDDKVLETVRSQAKAKGIRYDE